MTVKVDTSEFIKMIKDAKTGTDQAWTNTGKYFKSITPIRSGNARRRTQTTDTEIQANYRYAEALDNGHSPQARSGMTEPSLAYYKKQIDNLVRKI